MCLASHVPSASWGTVERGGRGLGGAGVWGLHGRQPAQSVTKTVLGPIEFAAENKLAQSPHHPRANKHSKYSCERMGQVAPEMCGAVQGGDLGTVVLKPGHKKTGAEKRRLHL